MGLLDPVITVVVLIGCAVYSLLTFSDPTTCFGGVTPGGAPGQPGASTAPRTYIDDLRDKLPDEESKKIFQAIYDATKSNKMFEGGNENGEHLLMTSVEYALEQPKDPKKPLCNFFKDWAVSSACTDVEKEGLPKGSSDPDKVTIQDYAQKLTDVTGDRFDNTKDSYAAVLVAATRSDLGACSNYAYQASGCRY